MHSTLSFLLDPIYPPTRHLLSSTRFPVCTFQESEIGGKGRDRCLPKHYVQRPVISLSHPYSLRNPRSHPLLTLVAKRAILQNPNNSTSVILDRFSQLRICTSFSYEIANAARQLLNPFLSTNSSLYRVLLLQRFVFRIRNRF